MNSAYGDPHKRQRSSSVHSRGGEETLISSKKYNQKANNACDTCRLKKVKCNEGQPVCGYCDSHGFRCDYRLRPMSSNEQILSTLLRRLVYVEDKLETILQFGNRPETREAQIAKDWAAANTPLATPSPAKTSDSQFQLSTDQVGLHLLSESAVILDKAANNYKALETFSDEAVVKLRYLEKTPFTCEEDRLPLPDFVEHTDPTKMSDIVPFMEYFLEHPCSMYPVMCDPSAHAISGSVVVQGFREDIQSCLTLLIVALSKAYRNEECIESGIADFQRATNLLGRLGIQFNLRRVQAHVLSAIFLLKKGRLLDFWSAIHAGCTILYTMVRRDQASGAERSMGEKNNISRIYWICYNLERDVKNEIDDTLPRSPLYHLEDSLPLPLGCDESDLLHLPLRVRTTHTFYLAEMSLKAVAERILTTADLGLCIQETGKRGVEVTPLFQELRRQVDEWTKSLPTFLGWSSEPTKGVPSPIGIRVKLMYWFVRFSLLRPLILHVLHDPSSPFPITGWTFFQEGLLAGLTVINILILEQSDIDAIMGNRIISVIYLLKETVAKGYFPVIGDGNISATLQEGIDILWRKLADKSEWIKCKLYSLETEAT